MKLKCQVFQQDNLHTLQGYYISRPIPQDEYIEFLETQIKENPQKYSDILTYRDEKLKKTKEVDSDLKSIKIDEDHKLIELIEEI